MWFELVGLAVSEHGFRPRLKWCVFEAQRIGCHTTRKPDTLFLRRVAEEHVPARGTWSGPGWPRFATASLTTLSSAALTAFGHAHLNARIRLRRLLASKWGDERR